MRVTRDEERVRSGGNPEFKIKIMLFVKAQSVLGLSKVFSLSINQTEGVKMFTLNTILCLKQFLIFEIISFQ